jgi:hypothetical protein
MNSNRAFPLRPFLQAITAPGAALTAFPAETEQRSCVFCKMIAWPDEQHQSDCPIVALRQYLATMEELYKEHHRPTFVAQMIDAGVVSVVAELFQMEKGVYTAEAAGVWLQWMQSVEADAIVERCTGLHTVMSLARMMAFASFVGFTSAKVHYWDLQEGQREPRPKTPRRMLATVIGTNGIRRLNDLMAAATEAFYDEPQLCRDVAAALRRWFTWTMQGQEFARRLQQLRREPQWEEALTLGMLAGLAFHMPTVRVSSDGTLDPAGAIEDVARLEFPPGRRVRSLIDGRQGVIREFEWDANQLRVIVHWSDNGPGLPAYTSLLLAIARRELEQLPQETPDYAETDDVARCLNAEDVALQWQSQSLKANAVWRVQTDARAIGIRHGSEGAGDQRSTQRDRDQTGTDGFAPSKTRLVCDDHRGLEQTD